MPKITIIGTGLIGTSIGLALKKSKASDLKIIGHDAEPTVARKAKKMGALDSHEWNLVRAVRDADMIILSVPVLAIKETMGQIASHLPEDCVITDTGSTKQEVIGWAREILPKSVHFVGGHPMAGKEDSGPQSASADLFVGATYCVLPSVTASKWAVEAIVSIVESIGATPFFIDPQEHDSIVAAVSHLPIAVSAALVSCTSKSPSWVEMAKLVSGGYRDVTRLASGDPEMNRDIFSTNSREIAGWIDRIIGELTELRKYLDDGDGKTLTSFFDDVYKERERLQAGLVVAPTGPNVEIPSTGDQMSSLLLGEVLSRKSKALLQQYEDRSKKSR